MTLRAHGVSVGIRVDANDHIGARIARSQDFYERDLLDDIYDKHPIGLAVDVGAHIGNHSLWFSMICGLKTVAMEPRRSSWKDLQKNVHDNGADVVPLNLAAGARCGTARLVEPRPNNTGMTSIVDDPEGTIAVVPLDLLDMGRVGLLKIDVEGHELAVLKGALRLLRQDKPLIYAEAADDEHLKEVSEFLGDLGYESFGCFCKTPTWGFVAA